MHDVPMNVGEFPRLDGMVPIVFAPLGPIVGVMSSIYMWDPRETCETRGGRSLSGEKLLWNRLLGWFSN